MAIKFEKLVTNQEGSNIKKGIKSRRSSSHAQVIVPKCHPTLESNTENHPDFALK